MSRSRYLKILGLSDPITEQELSKAWKLKLKSIHPDISRDPNAEEKSKKINEAYTYLKNNTKLESRIRDRKEKAKQDLYKSLKKRNRPDESPIKLPDIHLGRIKIPILHFLTPLPYTIENVIYRKPCITCLKPDIWSACMLCNQTGKYIENAESVYNYKAKMCKQCKGLGWVSRHTCKGCNSNLTVESKKDVKFTLTEDCRPGKIFTLKGEGNNHYLIKGKSDLIFSVSIDIPKLCLKDSDIEELIKLLSKVNK